MINKTSYDFADKENPLAEFTDIDMDIAYDISGLDPGFCQGALWQHGRDIKKFKQELIKAHCRVHNDDSVEYIMEEIFGKDWRNDM